MRELRRGILWRRQDPILSEVRHLPFPSYSPLRCVCNQLGTNVTAGACNRVSGQCQCFPHVKGQQCDQCEENHYDIASGQVCHILKKKKAILRVVLVATVTLKEW